jgi:hypothetical protein
MSNYLGGKVTMTTARGVSVKPDGVHPVSWLNNGTANLTLEVPLQSPVPLQIIHGIKMMDMGNTFNPAMPYVPTILSRSMTAGFKLPFNITVKAQSVSNSIALGYGGKVLGETHGSVTSQANSSVPGLISFALPPSPLVVKEDMHEEFNKFLAGLVIQEEDTFSLVGKSNATVETPMGNITLIDVPFNSLVTMKALTYNTQQPSVSEVQVVGGTKEHIIINLVVSLTNPSSLTIGVGNVTLMVAESTTGQFLGNLVIQNLTLSPTFNEPMRVPAQLSFHPNDTLVRDQLTSRYIAGETSLLHLTGSPILSTPIPELQRALSLISLNCSVPGLTLPPVLFRSGRANSTINTNLGSHITSSIWLDTQNPLNTSIFYSSLTANISWHGDTFGTINQTVGFLIPSNTSHITTPELTLRLPQDPGFSVFLVTQFFLAYPGVAIIGNGALVPFEMEVESRVRVGGENRI